MQKPLTISERMVTVPSWKLSGAGYWLRYEEQLMPVQLLYKQWKDEEYCLKSKLQCGITSHWGLPRWCSGKEFTCQCRRCKRWGFIPWVRKIPWSRKWQPTAVFLPGKFHEQKRLEGYCPWGCKESDMTERLSPHAPPHTDQNGHCQKVYK